MKKFIFSLLKKSGRILKDSFRKNQSLTLIRRHGKKIVTSTDKKVDKFLLETIRKKFPEHNILTEESGWHKGKSPLTWIIDPLDGTGNFANGNPLFSIVVALLKNEQLIFGAVYAPMIDEFYWAEKGKGAFLNHQPIKVSQVSNLKKSYFYFCEGGEFNRVRTNKIFSRIYTAGIDFRKIGSAGLEICWLAAGRAEGYVTTKISPWDVAAGVLIVQEAGGQVTNFQGQPWRSVKDDLIFSNTKIHQKLKQLVKGL